MLHLFLGGTEIRKYCHVMSQTHTSRTQAVEPLPVPPPVRVTCHGEDALQRADTLILGGRATVAGSRRHATSQKRSKDLDKSSFQKKKKKIKQCVRLGYDKPSTNQDSIYPCCRPKGICWVGGHTCGAPCRWAGPPGGTQRQTPGWGWYRLSEMNPQHVTIVTAAPSQTF